MKRFVTVIAVLILAGSGSRAAFADTAASGAGIGFVIGNPTGVSAKFWTSRVNAIDIMAGFGDENIHVGYLWHKYGLFRPHRGRLPLYYGIGGAIDFDHDHDHDRHHDHDDDYNDTAIGVRVPLGLSYMFPRDPVEIFFEIAPVVYIISKADLDFTAGLGVRFFF